MQDQMFHHNKVDGTPRYVDLKNSECDSRLVMDWSSVAVFNHRGTIDMSDSDKSLLYMMATDDFMNTEKHAKEIITRYSLYRQKWGLYYDKISKSNSEESDLSKLESVIRCAIADLEKEMVDVVDEKK